MHGPVRALRTTECQDNYSVTCTLCVLASLPQPDLEVRSLRNAARQYPCARPLVLSPRAAAAPEAEQQRRLRRRARGKARFDELLGERRVDRRGAEDAAALLASAESDPEGSPRGDRLHERAGLLAQPFRRRLRALGLEHQRPLRIDGEHAAGETLPAG